MKTFTWLYVADSEQEALRDANWNLKRSGKDHLFEVLSAQQPNPHLKDWVVTLGHKE